MDLEWTIRRRRIGPQDLVLIRELISTEGHRGRSYISQRLCEIWDWRQDNGRFRQIACRDLLRQLEARSVKLEIETRYGAGLSGLSLDQHPTPAGRDTTKVTKVVAVMSVGGLALGLVLAFIVIITVGLDMYLSRKYDRTPKFFTVGLRESARPSTYVAD